MVGFWSGVERCEVGAEGDFYSGDVFCSSVSVSVSFSAANG